MEATEAFTAFIHRVLTPAKTARYSALAANARGQRKLLRELDHDFERAIRADARRRTINRHPSPGSALGRGS